MAVGVEPIKRSAATTSRVSTTRFWQTHNTQIGSETACNPFLQLFLIGFEEFHVICGPFWYCLYLMGITHAQWVLANIYTNFAFQWKFGLSVLFGYWYDHNIAESEWGLSDKRSPVITWWGDLGLRQYSLSASGPRSWHTKGIQFKTVESPMKSVCISLSTDTW